ncbi:MAG TPA: PLP-dependent aminotransferase family protein [Anaerolineales bacterium]|jgi:GntR family transcriptional regulator/MocR family aminotransferase|nr:PLP-dependent aminotransferase family protein [Anaerolineales bacterium]
MIVFTGNLIHSEIDSPLHRQLYTHLQTAILRGDLKPGTRLPSTRALATQLNISRNTVLNAYQQLIAEGYLDGRVGRGTFVAQILPDHLLTAPQPRDLVETLSAEPDKPRFSEQARLQLSVPRMPLGPPDGTSVSARPFRFGVPALRSFPYKLWSRLLIHKARHLPASAFPYQHAAGYSPLREAIAAHAMVSRGVHCTAEQIIVMSGAQGGLDLAARVLINAGDPVWMEDPGYLKARGAFLGSGANIIPVPVDQEGLVVEAGVARAPGARLAYLTPSHQFPLGVTLSLARRLALLDWAKRADAYILEDDYDSEYHYTRRPLPALQGLDHDGRVIYIGTFSKVLFPALRIGYLILPPPLVEAFRTVRNLIDTHPPMLEQAVLADFIVEGHFTRHLRKMRSLYAERRAAILEAAHKINLEIHPPEAGMHCVGWLPQGMDAFALVREAANRGVDIVPVSHFSIEPLARDGILLGYSEYSVEQIQNGMRHLGMAMSSV